jgi:hypothetical protein
MVRNYFEHKDKTTAEDTNPYYILPRTLQERLQKIMEEYVAGTSTFYSTFYQTNGKLLSMGLQYLTTLKGDSKKMRAKDLHELLRRGRIITASSLPRPTCGTSCSARKRVIPASTIVRTSRGRMMPTGSVSSTRESIATPANGR